MSAPACPVEFVRAPKCCSGVPRETSCAPRCPDPIWTRPGAKRQRPARNACTTTGRARNSTGRRRGSGRRSALCARSSEQYQYDQAGQIQRDAPEQPALLNGFEVLNRAPLPATPGQFISAEPEEQTSGHQGDNAERRREERQINRKQKCSKRHSREQAPDWGHQKRRPVPPFQLLRNFCTLRAGSVRRPFLGNPNALFRRRCGPDFAAGSRTRPRSRRRPA